MSICIRIAALVFATLAALVGAPTVASATPGQLAHLESIEKISDRHFVLDVYSPSMDTVEALDVLLPADSSVPRPVLYALNGAGQGVVDKSGWFDATDIIDFMADKNVNVVSPRAGTYTYYTDWVNDDPAIGRAKWQTFLTEELPPVIDAALGTDGVQSIMGMSMSASSALDLAAQSGDLYSGVAAFSGCGRTTDDLGRAYIEAVVGWRGKADLTNMWGPVDGPGWAGHDVVRNAERLRGKTLYLASRTGLPGPLDTPDQVRLNGQTDSFAAQIIAGGGIEAATNECMTELADRLAVLGIPAVTDLDSPGTHSWGYWEQDLRKSWPTLAASMGLSA